VGVRTSQICVGFYFLSREPGQPSNIFSSTRYEWNWCAANTQKNNLKRQDFLAFVLTVRLLLCRCNYELPSRQIGHSKSLPRISEKLSNMIHQKWRKAWQDVNLFKNHEGSLREVELKLKRYKRLDLRSENDTGLSMRSKKCGSDTEVAWR